MIELPNARTLLLIDGAGGALSAFFLGVVLTQCESFIGIQRETLWLLAAIACAFAAYSLTSYAFGKEYKRLLRIVAVANLAYCCLTLGVMYYFSETLRAVGAVYFFCGNSGDKRACGGGTAGVFFVSGSGADA